MNLTKRKGLRPAVFLDRDGTLIEDRGHLSSPDEVRFFSATIGALERLREDFSFFLVTNQPGVAEGLLTLEQVARVNARVVSVSESRTTRWRWHCWRRSAAPWPHRAPILLGC